MFGYGNDVVAPNPEYQRTFEGFQTILRTVLPPVLGFQRLHIEMPEVVIETDTGSFSLDAVSGGVSAILDMAWQIYMYSTVHDEFCVVIDEPENHLHPELQQTLLPSLLKAFPTAQFTIATHNPFMVSSVPDSHVYVLQFERDNRVTSQLLDTVNKAGTSNDILRDVLGLAFTMPLWAEQQLEALVTRYSQMGLTEQSLAQLRAELAELGMSHVVPETLSRVIDETE